MGAERLLIRNVRVHGRDKDLGDLPRADILIKADAIAAVGPDLVAPEGPVEVIDGTGLCAIPGLINAHFHSPATLGKGSLDGLPLELFMLYEVPPLSDRPPPARLVHVRALLAAIEMLKTGVTAVQDDAFFVPCPDPESIDALMSAYERVGIRATVALDQPNVREYLKYPFLAEILPAEVRARMDRAPLQSGAELVALYDHLHSRWHGAAHGRLRTAVSCSAPHRVTPDYMDRLSAISAQRGLPFYVHVLETRVQRVFGQEVLGHSLVEHLHRAGHLTDRVNLIHGIWIDAPDMDRIADAGTTVVHNPVCNLRLGSGIMPFRALRDRGIPVALGTDESLADDSVNLWQAVKMTGLVHTITDPDPMRWPHAGEVLECLWQGGARAMGQAARLGRIAPGAAADITLIDLDSLAFTPLNDLERQLVYCETGGSVAATIVAGRVVMRGGRVLTVDEAEVRAEARALVAEYAPAAARAAEAARALDPHYREMYARAARTDVGFTRWAGGV